MTASPDRGKSVLRLQCRRRRTRWPRALTLRLPGCVENGHSRQVAFLFEFDQQSESGLANTIIPVIQEFFEQLDRIVGAEAPDHVDRRFLVFGFLVGREALE